MKILLAHNYYQQSGGEDTVYKSEKALLQRGGNQVLIYERHNREIEQYSAAQNLGLIGKTFWSKESYSDIKAIIQKESPQIAHFHNTFPLISPAAYYACQEAGIPIIQTVHNYRLLCSNALLYRDGHICEACLGKNPPWPGLLYGCYQDSRAKTLVLVSMLAYHRFSGTWEKVVDRFVALSNFSRNKLIQGGLPSEKIVVKPNFVFPDPGRGEGQGKYFIVVGRLSQEKGIEFILNAWRKLSRHQLKIVGDGPLMEDLQEFTHSQELNNVEFCGWMPPDRTIELIQGSRAVIFPSRCYENFPLVIAEAFASGRPVIAPRLGVMQDIVKHKVNGLLFAPEDENDFIANIDWIMDNPGEILQMGLKARHDFEIEYSAENNYLRLMKIYEQAIHH